MKAILCSLLLATLPAAAGPNLPTADLLRLGVVPPEAITRHREQLNLSPEQDTKVRELFDKAKEEGPTLETAIQEERARLEAMVQNGSAPIEQAEAQLEALLNAEGAVKRLQLRTVLGMNAALSPEQRGKALGFAQKDAELEPIIKAKVERIKTAVDSLGCKPTPAIEERGQAIGKLLESGDPAEANKALDAAIADLGVDEPVSTEPIDFTQFDPGNTELTVLEQRFHTTEEKIKTLIRLPKLRQMLQAHQALEDAKASQDATAVGRILTWAEGSLN